MSDKKREIIVRLRSNDIGFIASAIATMSPNRLVALIGSFAFVLGFFVLLFGKEKSEDRK